jgi:murein DD-endopeptidase MepM/ murein hydrolase activator NlpD
MTKPARLATGLGIVAALAAGSAVAGHVAADDPVAGSLTSAAAALETADRLQTPEPPAPEPEPDPPPAGKLLFPLAEATLCGVLNNFGDPRDGGTRSHEAVDIIATAGTPVFAVVDGRLTTVYSNTGTAGYGWTLEDANGTVFRYFHLEEDLRGWEVGDRVRAGDVIGSVGDSGNDPGNYHLHFEYRPNNTPRDPYDLLDIPDWCNRW